MGELLLTLFKGRSLTFNENSYMIFFFHPVLIGENKNNLNIQKNLRGGGVIFKDRVTWLNFQLAHKKSNQNQYRIIWNKCFTFKEVRSIKKFIIPSMSLASILVIARLTRQFLPVMCAGASGKRGGCEVWGNRRPASNLQRLRAGGVKWKSGLSCNTPINLQARVCFCSSQLFPQCSRSYTPHLLFTKLRAVKASLPTLFHLVFSDILEREN